MNKDVLPKSTVSIGIQILNLKAVSVALADGREGDWMWDKGSDASLTVLGKYIQQISPEIVRKEEENLPGTFMYGFRSDELRDLAAVMFRSLTADDICKLVDTRTTENFPYKVQGMYLQTCEGVRDVLMMLLIGRVHFTCKLEGREQEVLDTNLHSCPCCHALTENTPKLLAHITLISSMIVPRGPSDE